MNTVGVNKNKKCLQAVTKIQVMRGELSGCSEDVKDLVLLLLSYFDEKEDVMFCYVEDTCLAGELQMDQVRLTPTIVVCGKLKFMLYILGGFTAIKSVFYYICQGVGNSGPQGPLSCMF